MGIAHGSVELHIRDGHFVSYSAHERFTVSDPDE
jgi:hypothetical protein